MLLQVLAVNLKTYSSWMEWVDRLGLTVKLAEGYVSGVSDGLSILRLGMDTITDGRSESRVKLFILRLSGDGGQMKRAKIVNNLRLRYLRN